MALTTPSEAGVPVVARSNSSDSRLDYEKESKDSLQTSVPPQEQQQQQRQQQQSTSMPSDLRKPLPPPSGTQWILKPEHGWRRVIQNFTPSWFSATMGTGIVSVLLYSIPFQAHWLRILSSIVFVANIALFALVFGASALRYALYPCTWTLMVHHPVQSLFLGTAPMGFATLINSFVALCIQHGQWGPWAQTFAWTMWWIDVAASVATCIGMPFMIMSAHKTSLQTLTAAWLLPIVAPIVASASGAVVASELTDPQHALWTIVVSYVLWGVGVPLAMVILVMYFHRLAMHKLPPREVIVSVFLPLGPLGQGGFGIQKLGAEAMRVFPRTGTLHPLAGDVLYVAGLGVALVLWGFGLVWLFFAVGSISGSKFPFNMGWWGFTFPLGVYALSTITIGEELPSLFFRVLGTVFAVCVILLWMVVVAGTAKRLPSGRMFDAPCLRTAGEPTAKELAIMKRDEENQQSEDQTCGFAQP